MSTFQALTVYVYYDGPALFTAQEAKDDQVRTGNIYLFRWVTESDDPDDDIGDRLYKADGYDITVREGEVDWSEANF